MDTNIDRNPTGDSAFDYIKKSFELKNLKLYKEAIEMLYKALGCEDIGEQNTEVVSQIGDLYFLLKNYDRAIDQYEKAIDATSTHTHSLYQLCEICTIQNSYEKALGLIKQLCKAAPDLKSYINYFKILLKMERYQAMMALYDSLDEKFKKSDEILYTLSCADSQNREHYLKEVVAINPKNTDAQLDLGKIYFNRDELQSASICFKSIVDSDVKCAAAHYFLGLMAQKHSQYSRAIEFYLQATKIEPQNGDYFFDLGKAYTDIAWYDEAQTAICESLRLLRVKDSKSNFDEHYFTLAWVFIQKKDFKSALMNLEFISPDSKIAGLIKVLSCLITIENGEPALAKAGLEECYLDSSLSKNPILLSSLGRVYKELKLYDRALKIYEQALELYPDSFEYASELVDILIDAKCYDEALRIAHKFKEEHPKVATVYNSIARIYYRQDKKEDALASLKELIKLDANQAEVHYFCGLILNDLKRSEEAINCLLVALELDPGVSKYYAQLAKAYMSTKDYTSAGVFIKEAIGMLPQEIAYLKLAQEIFKFAKDKNAEKFYTSQVRRLEKLLKTR